MRGAGSLRPTPGSGIGAKRPRRRRPGGLGHWTKRSTTAVGRARAPGQRLHDGGRRGSGTGPKRPRRWLDRLGHWAKGFQEYGRPERLQHWPAIRLVADLQGVGHVREDPTSKPVLFWPVDRYLVIYGNGRQPAEIVPVLTAYRASLCGSRSPADELSLQAARAGPDLRAFLQPFSTCTAPASWFTMV